MTALPSDSNAPPPRILITGAAGQLASDLAVVLDDCDLVLLKRSQLDITDHVAVDRLLAGKCPQVLINTAAFHHVDLCEAEPEASFAVNAAAVRRLASACAENATLLVHFSTDYVFDGAQTHPYDEDDRVAPLSVYATSKAAGEMAIRCTTPDHLIIRTTGLYGLAGATTSRGNFVETMLRLAARNAPIEVVADQVLTPSFTLDVAQAVATLIAKGTRGTVHVTNSGACSWFEFAAEIFHLSGFDLTLRETKQAQRVAAAERPAYSVLNHRRLQEAGVPELRHWSDALSHYLSLRSEILASRPVSP